MSQRIFLAPSKINIQAKKLKKEGKVKEALDLLQEHVVEFNIDEQRKLMSAKIIRHGVPSKVPSISNINKLGSKWGIR